MVLQLEAQGKHARTVFVDGPKKKRKYKSWELLLTSLKTRSQPVAVYALYVKQSG